MRRLFALIVVALSTIALPGHAAVTTNAGFAQWAHVSVQENFPSGWYNGDIYFSNQAGEISTGPSATPNTTFAASGQVYSYDQNQGYTLVNFDNQIVSPTALSMDPIGNSATLTACLQPKEPGPCHQFTLTLSKPQYLSYGCTIVVCPSLNAYVAPDGSAAGDSTQVYPGIFRSGYTVSGTFDGAPVPVPSQSSYVYADSTNSYSAGASAVAP